MEKKKKGLMFKPIVFFFDSQMLEHSTLEHYCRSVRIESINKQVFGEQYAHCRDYGDVYCLFGGRN